MSTDLGPEELRQDAGECTTHHGLVRMEAMFDDLCDIALHAIEP